MRRSKSYKNIMSAIGLIRRIVCILVLCFCALNVSHGVVSASTVTVYADDGESSGSSSGGIINKNSGIYKTGGSGTKGTEATTGSPSWLEKQISKLLSVPGQILLSLEESWNMTLDNIIYGRIETAGTNFYGFELVAGNPYGVVGAFMYNIFRVVCWIIIMCIFMGQLTKAALVSNSAKNREEAKSSIGKFVTMSLFLYLMPYIVDLVIYVRDVFLYLIRSMTSSITMTDSSGNAVGVGKGISEVFAGMVDQSWIWALVFTASSVLALYFAYMYVSVAMGMTLYFSMFPLVCVMSYMDKNLLNNWVKSVMSAVLVPVIDAILLILPVTVFNVVKGQGYSILAGLLTLMICMMLIPTRKLIGQLLGLNMGGIGAMAGAAMGFMAMARGASAIGRSLREGRQHRRNAKSALEEADMLDELGKEDASAQKGFNDAIGIKPDMPDIEGGRGQASGDEADTSLGFAGGAMGEANGSPGDYSGLTNISAVPFNSSVATGLSTMTKASGGGKDGTDGTNFNAQAKLANMGLKSDMNSENSRIDDERANESPGDYSGLTNISAVPFDSSVATGLSAMAAASGGGKGGTGGTNFNAQAKLANMGLKSNINSENSRIDDEKDFINETKGHLNSGIELPSGVREQYNNDIASAQSRIDESQGYIKDMQVQMDNNSAAAMISQAKLDQARQRVIDSHANINNMNSAAFSNISNQRRAELLREYARSEQHRARASTVGAAVGGVYGATAGLFFGPTATVAMAAGGMVAGEHAGNSAGGAIYNISTNTAPGRMAAAGFRAAKSSVSVGVRSMPEVRPVVRTYRSAQNVILNGTEHMQKQTAALNNYANELEQYKQDNFL